MIDFKKDILDGIEATRARIMPGSGKNPAIYMLKNDNGCELLVSKIMQYHWKIDKNSGLLTDEPYSNNNDELDSLRISLSKRSFK